MRRVLGAWRPIVRSLVSLVITMLIASIAVFFLMRVVPGDPVSILTGEANVTAQTIEEVRNSLGLDQPIWGQYLDWLWNALHGDLGASYFSRNPVVSTIFDTLPRTLSIVVGGIVLGSLIGIPAGILGAIRVRRASDAAVRHTATFFSAIPNFWLGGVLVGLFALNTGWLPATGFVSLSEDPAGFFQHLILPWVAASLTIAASIARQTRSAMLEALSSDSIRTLRAMGVSERAIIWQHALKNAAIPIVTIIGLDVNRAISGVVVIEAVFGIPGMGSQIANSVRQRDFPVVQGGIITLVLFVMVVNFLLDVVYSMLDPRSAQAEQSRSGFLGRRRRRAMLVRGNRQRPGEQAEPVLVEEPAPASAGGQS